MDERHERAPAGAQHREKRRRRDHERFARGAPCPRCDIPGGRPAPEIRSEHEPRLALLQDEGAVRELSDRRAVEAPLVRSPDRGARRGAGRRSRRLRSGPDAGRARSRPDGRSPRAGTPHRGGGRLRARSPRRGRRAPCSGRAAAVGFCRRPRNSSRHAIQRFTAKRRRMRPCGIVKAAAIAVHEAAGGVRDQIAERRDPVLERAQT